MNQQEIFERDAMGYLLGFLKAHKGPFCAESVTLAAMDDGIAPRDLREWGKVFQRASREGYIRRSRVAFQRVLGHGSLTLGWERC